MSENEINTFKLLASNSGVGKVSERCQNVFSVNVFPAKVALQNSSPHQSATWKVARRILKRFNEPLEITVNIFYRICKVLDVKISTVARWNGA